VRNEIIIILKRNSYLKIIRFETRRLRLFVYRKEELSGMQQGEQGEIIGTKRETEETCFQVKF